MECPISKESNPSGRVFEPFLVSFRRVLALPAELQKGLGPSGSASEDLGHAFRKGQPFPASGPFAPAGRGRRAEKAACDFADALSTSATPVTCGLQRLSRRIPKLKATHRSVPDPRGDVHRSRILNSRPTVPLRTGQHVDPFAIEPRMRGSPRSASTLAKAV